MKILLTTAVRLLQRMGPHTRLVIVTTIFLVPLILTLGLLYAELQDAVGTAERERAGVRHAIAREELGQQHRSHDEVLKPSNQTSFGELDSVLAQRIELLRARLHMTILAALGVLGATAYLLGRFYVWLPAASRKFERPVRHAADGALTSHISLDTNDKIGELMRAPNVGAVPNPARMMNDLLAPTGNGKPASNG